MKRVDPKLYTKEYYLKDCGGYEEYLNHRGNELDSRLQSVFKRFSDVKGKTILDIGCGHGELCVKFARDAIKLANEIKSIQPAKTRNKIRFYNYDAKDILHLKKTFDIVIMTEVYEHLYQEELDFILENIKRILSKDGVFFIHTSPNKLFYDIFYKFWCYPVSEILINIWNIFSGKSYGRLIKYEELRNPYHNVMHVNEPTYFGLLNIVRKHGYKGKIRTTNITAIKPVYSAKDTIYNFLVYFYPFSKLFPFNIIMGCDFNIVLKSDEN